MNQLLRILCAWMLLVPIGTGTVLAQQNTPLEQDATSGKRFHTIAKGETLYSLTKRYQVTAEEICAANPGLSAANFQIGAVILIPASTQVLKAEEPVAKAEVQTPQGLAGSNCKEMYKVKKKETLFSISQKFGVTLDELRQANPETQKEGFELKKKMILCIPYHQTQVEKVDEKVPSNETLFKEARKPSAGLSTIRMGVILPLKDKSTTAVRTLDFYRGLLMAVDSLKRNGVSFEVYTFDAGKTSDDIQKVLARPIAPMLDVIFGPTDPTQIKAVSQFSKAHNIPMVVPFYSKSAELKENPYFFVLHAPDSIKYKEVTSLFTSTFYKHSLLLIETDQQTDDLVMSLKQKFTNIRYAKLPLSVNTLLSRLDAEKENVIMLSSSDLKSLNILMPVLREALRTRPDLKVKLFGYPDWQAYTSQMLDDFYSVDTYIYSPFFLNYSAASYRSFSNSFLHNFKQEMLNGVPRMGAYGFDTGLYFLKALQRYGKSFAGQEVYTAPLQHKFRMRRISNWGGMLNCQMQLIHYNKSHQIELIEKP